VRLYLIVREEPPENPIVLYEKDDRIVFSVFSLLFTANINIVVQSVLFTYWSLHPKYQGYYVLLQSQIFLEEPMTIQSTGRTDDLGEPKIKQPRVGPYCLPDCIPQCVESRLEKHPCGALLWMIIFFSVSLVPRFCGNDFLSSVFLLISVMPVMLAWPLLHPGLIFELIKKVTPIYICAQFSFTCYFIYAYIDDEKYDGATKILRLISGIILLPLFGFLDAFPESIRKIWGKWISSLLCIYFVFRVIFYLGGFRFGSHSLDYSNDREFKMPIKSLDATTSAIGVSVACMINIIIHWLYSACNYYHWPEEFAYLRARIRPDEFEIGDNRGIYSCIMRNGAISSVELEIGEIGASTPV